MSAAAICRRAWNLESCPATGLPWTTGSLWLLSGPPGAGKTTLALGIAGGMERPVLVLAGEMSLGAGLAGVLRRAGLGRREDIRCVRQASVSALVDATKRGEVVLLDSIQSLRLQASDGRMLADLGGVVLAVAQVTKAGVPAGSNEWAHESDIHLHVEAGGWKLIKSRYEGPGRTGQVPGLGAQTEVSHEQMG